MPNTRHWTLHERSASLPASRMIFHIQATLKMIQEVGVHRVRLGSILGKVGVGHLSRPTTPLGGLPRATRIQDAAGLNQKYLTIVKIVLRENGHMQRSYCDLELERWGGASSEWVGRSSYLCKFRASQNPGFSPHGSLNAYTGILYSHILQ